MATMRLRYVHSFVDKTGRVRFYFRYRGKRWPLPGEPGTAEFAASYDALRQECLATQAENNIVFGPGTLGAIIESYLASDEYESKARKTRLKYRHILDQLREIAGRGLIVDLQEHHVRQIRTRFEATSTADVAVMLLGMLWTFAKEKLALRLGINPAADIQNLHRQARQHEPWPPEIIAKFEAEGQPQPNAQLALLLLLYTGQRAGDVAAMRWSQYDGAGIEVKQQKTGTKVWIACHSKLKAVLDSLPRRSEYILTTQRRGGYSAGSLCNMIAAATAAIGAKQFTAHGLRKNATIALAEAGCSVPEIMAITGHRTWQQAMHYSARVSQRKLARQAIERLEKVAKTRTNTKSRHG